MNLIMVENDFVLVCFKLTKNNNNFLYLGTSFKKIGDFIEGISETQITCTLCHFRQNSIF